MKHIGFFCILISILIIGCKFQNSSTQTFPYKKINISPENVSDLYLETSMDTFYFLTLSTDKDFLLSHIDKMFFTEKSIAVTDNSGSIFIYDRQGKPENKIFARGKGPGEYISISDLFFDKVLKQFEIYDNPSKKILIYDFKGKFLNEKKIVGDRLPGLRFTKFKDTYIFDHGQVSSDGKRLGIFDKDLHHLKSFINIPETVKRLGYGHLFTMDQFNDTLYCVVPMMDDKIYSIKKDTITPVYEIDYPGKDLNKLNTTENLDEIDKYSTFSSSSSQIYDLSFLFVNHDFITLKYYFKGKPSHMFYSKKSGHVKQYFQIRSLKNDFLRIISGIIAKDGDYFVIPIHESLNKYLPENIKKKLDENSNPVLLFIKLKEF
jgi:hypothetical protein